MNSFHSSEQLSTEADGRADGEATFRLAAAQFCQIAALKVHHYVVESLIAATADESTDVVLTYNNTQYASLRSQAKFNKLRLSITVWSFSFEITAKYTWPVNRCSCYPKRSYFGDQAQRELQIHIWSVKP